MIFKNILAGRCNAFSLECVDNLLRPESLLAVGEDTFDGLRQFDLALHIPDLAGTNLSAFCIVVVGSSVDIQRLAECVDREMAVSVKRVYGRKLFGQCCLRGAGREGQNPVDGLLVLQRLRDEVEVARRVFRWRTEAFAYLDGVLPVVVGALGYAESGKGFPYWTDGRRNAVQ